MDDFDALVADYLEGRLDEAGIERLSERVRGDDALRARFLEMAGIEGLLRAELAPSDLHDELVRRITLCLVGRDQEERTAERVLERIQDRAGSGAPAGPELPADASRTTSRTRSRRRLAAYPGADPSPVWGIAAVAAALLIAVLLFLAHTGAPRDHASQAPQVARGPEPAPTESARPPDPVPPSAGPVRAPDAGRDTRPPEPAVPAATAPETPPAPVAPKVDRPTMVSVPETSPPVAPSTPTPAPDRTTTVPRTAVVPARDMTTAVARLESLSGEVKVTGSSGAATGKAGLALSGGQGILTGGGAGGALVRYPDGTSLLLGPETEVRDLADAEGGAGKRLFVARGMLSAEVAKQSPDRPMVLTTPHGDARVLGTSLRLVVDADPDGVTRLEVRTGKVRLTRARDGRSVDVTAGSYADLAPAGDLPAPKRVLTVAFQDGVAPVTSYEGTRDAYIAEHKSLAPRIPGSSAILVADGDSADSGQPGMDRSALIRWDLTALPRGVVVVWAEVGIQVINGSGGRPFWIREMKREWLEGQVTWAGPASVVPWQKPGAQGEMDREAAPLGSMAPSAPGPYSVPLNVAGLAAVQSWINNPAVNHGLILADTENGDALIFKSRKAIPPAERPRLTVSVVPR